MTAPTPSTRGTPNGRKLGDGYQTLVSFASNVTMAIWEKSITPPGVEGDAPNDTTTMHNLAWRTRSPRHLKTLTEFTMAALWDPKIITGLVTQVNRPDTVTVHFPDGSTLAFYGFLKSFKPGTLEEGKIPEISVDVVCTNQDPITCAEEAPVLGCYLWTAA